MSRILNHDRSYSTSPRITRAYTLVELLIVVAIMGIIAGLVITRFEPSFYDQLRGAAQVVTTDLAYARSLAVANNSQYTFTFDPAGQRFWLEHSGTNATLDNLPESPYRDPADPLTRQTTDLRRLPSASMNLELVAVRNVSSTTESETNRVEFESLGALAQSEDCWIWLAIGQGNARRYLPVELDAITGLAKIGDFQVRGPRELGPSADSGTLLDASADASGVPLPGPLAGP